MNSFEDSMRLSIHSECVTNIGIKWRVRNQMGFEANCRCAFASFLIGYRIMYRIPLMNFSNATQLRSRRHVGPTQKRAPLKWEPSSWWRHPGIPHAWRDGHHLTGRNAVLSIYLSLSPPPSEASDPGSRAGVELLVASRPPIHHVERIAARKGVVWKWPRGAADLLPLLRLTPFLPPAIDGLRVIPQPVSSSWFPMSAFLFRPNWSDTPLSLFRVTDT